MAALNDVLVFVGYNPPSVYSIKPDGTGLTVILAGQSTSNVGDTTWTTVTASLDGTKLLVGGNRHVTGGLQKVVYVTDPDGSNQVAVPFTAGLTAWDPSSPLTLSPDKTKLAGNTGVAIFTQNVDGTGYVSLYSGLDWTSEGNAGAWWSPDGSKIAFDLSDSAGNYLGPAVVNADGSGFKRLFPDGSQNTSIILGWFPDSKNLLVANADVGTFRKTDGVTIADIVQVSAWFSNSICGSISYDGSRIAYCDSGPLEMVSTAPGSTPVALSGASGLSTNFETWDLWWVWPPQAPSSPPLQIPPVPPAGLIQLGRIGGGSVRLHGSPSSFWGR